MEINSRLNLNHSIEIPGCSIDRDSDCYIIAEIGINHGGDYILAQEMVEAAFEAGANAAKFQIVNPEESYSKNNISYSVFSKAGLSDKQIYDLVNNNKKKGTVFATPGDISSLKKCIDANMQLYKVSSGLLTNRPLIKQIAKTKKPIILSSGMANLKEVSSAVKYAQISGCRNIAVLQCTSIYPAPFNTINLSAMGAIQKICNSIVGYSDHCMGWLACSTAVAMGAKIIEKHFTFDNKSLGADHHISLNYKDFSRMVTDIRNIEKMYGNGIKEPHEEEIVNLKNIRRYCVAKTNINPGDLFSLDNVVFKRLGNEKKGIEAIDFHKIENTESSSLFKIGSIIKKDKSSE